MPQNRGSFLSGAAEHAFPRRKRGAECLPHPVRGIRGGWPRGGNGSRSPPVRSLGEVVEDVGEACSKRIASSCAGRGPKSPITKMTSGRLENPLGRFSGAAQLDGDCPGRSECADNKRVVRRVFSLVPGSPTGGTR